MSSVQFGGLRGDKSPSIDHISNHQWIWTGSTRFIENCEVEIDFLTEASWLIAFCLQLWISLYIFRLTVVDRFAGVCVDDVWRFRFESKETWWGAASYISISESRPSIDFESVAFSSSVLSVESYGFRWQHKHFVCSFDFIGTPQWMQFIFDDVAIDKEF